MKKIFLSPHDDDHVLFGSYTCLRERPTIIVVTDSWIQPNRGEAGCDAISRAKETEEACRILECPVERLGLRDDNVTEEMIVQALKKYNVDVVYAPAVQGGNIHHDMVSRAADKVFGDRVIHYTTYTKTELYTEGNIEIIPIFDEQFKKKLAMNAYQSQIRVNFPHFEVMLNKGVDSSGTLTTKSEWLGDPQMIYLGAGKHHMAGWLHLDRHPYPGIDIVCDITKGIPLSDNSVSHVYSQDFMEHLPPEYKVFVINEIWRVLKPGGLMEHFIPNAGSRNDFGSPTHLSHWSLQQFEHFDVDSYRFEKDRDYEGTVGGFKKILAETVNNEQSIHVRYAAVK